MSNSPIHTSPIHTSPADGAEEQRQGPVTWIAVHDLSLTGVPVLLSRLLRATPSSQQQSVHVVAIFGGPLLSTVQALCASVTVLEPTDRRSLSSAASLGFITVGMSRAGSLIRQAAWRAKLMRRPQPDVLLVHGAGAWPVAEVVSRNVPIALHLQELEIALDRSIPLQLQAAAFERAKTVMTVSEPVAQLAARRGAQLGKMVMMPGCVDFADTAHSAALEPIASGVSEGQPLTDGEQWVLGAGTPGWRKGTDRLAAIAHELIRSGSSAKVGWVGGRPQGQNVTAIGRADPVTWFAAQPNPWEILSHARVFILPSREDPMPLVALEAGLHRSAVVAMPTGGLPSLLASGRGLFCPSQNMSDFVDLVQQVLASSSQAEEMGERLHEYVRSHHDVAVIAPLWLQALSQTAGR
ncbi:MAG: glycosyltransferase family 4 protein [Microthrixaceae bacterium]